jgi:hypothetical protein
VSKHPSNPSSTTELEQALHAALPVASEAETAGLARLLRALIAGDLGPETVREQLDADPALAHLLRGLVGQQIGEGQSAVAFGEGSQVGDVSIRDVVGRDLITINVYHGSPEANLPPMASPPARGVRRALRVFLCHSSADKLAVRKLSVLLAEGGAEPWLDEERLIAGQDWQREIPAAVEQSDVVLVCLSRDAVSREGYLRDEIAFALSVAERRPEGEIFLIPLLLEPCEVPSRLARWHWVSLAEPQGMGRLLRALQARATELGAIPPDLPTSGWYPLPASKPQPKPQPKLTPHTEPTQQRRPESPPLLSRRDLLIVGGVGVGAAAVLLAGRQILLSNAGSAAPTTAAQVPTSRPTTVPAQASPVAAPTLAPTAVASVTTGPTAAPAVAVTPLASTVVGEPVVDDINWPPRPAFSHVTDKDSQREELFGTIEWVSTGGTAIRITNGWDEQNIVSVTVPQLAVLTARGIPGVPPDGVIQWHSIAVNQLLGLWAAWERASLLDRILSYNGDYYPRTIRMNPSLLNNHAYGTAFDLNAQWNGLMQVAALVGEPGSVRELVPLANQYGFWWGGHWSFDGEGASDGMHFEVAVIL